MAEWLSRSPFGMFHWRSPRGWRSVAPFGAVGALQPGEAKQAVPPFRPLRLGVRLVVPPDCVAPFGLGGVWGWVVFGVSGGGAGVCGFFLLVAGWERGGGGGFGGPTGLHTVECAKFLWASSKAWTDSPA